MRMPRRLYIAMLMFLSTISLGSPPPAQQPPLQGNIRGDFDGTLGPLRVKLHITAAADGKLIATLDSPDQGANGIPCVDVKVEGQTLTFSVPAVGGTWKGTIEDNGAKLSGTWNQGVPTPLTFTRDTFVAASKPSPVDGFWLGTLQPPSPPLKVQLTVKSDQSGQEFCTLDSLDQGAFGLPCANVVFSGSDFSFEIPVANGGWRGKLSADGKVLDGTWTQGPASPLRFERQAAPQIPPAPKPAAYDPAIAPVSAAGLQAVLARDLEKALKSGGTLAPGTAVGVSIGVVRNGQRRVFAFGTAKTDSIFEIGSITKTFTGLLLAQMIAQKKVTPDTPVRELLPPGTVAKPQGPEITLLDLVTQHSGLPPMPDNFKPADPSNPYADYRVANLYQFIGKQGVAKPATTAFLYSNLGLGLLGQALANHANTTYADLLKQAVLEPLGMRDTAIALSPAQQRRFIQGHSGDPSTTRVRPWDLEALAGAGAIRSTANDMLTYLEANLRPEKARTLSSALTQSHELRADAGADARIAFAWLYVPETGEYWHNGATGGYSSFCVFNPKENYAAVVLVNKSVGGDGSFADLLGQHILQRFAGKPAISLAD